MEISRKDGSITDEIYRQRLADYRGKMLEYNACIRDYRLANNSYSQKMDFCKQESKACLKRLIPLNRKE